MAAYRFITPSIEALISDDYLSYEGISRPWRAMSIADGSGRVEKNNENILVVEQYCLDVQTLICKKLYDFSSQSDPLEADGLKLIALMQELIKVKKILSQNNVDNIT